MKKSIMILPIVLFEILIYSSACITPRNHKSPVNTKDLGIEWILEGMNRPALQFVYCTDPNETDIKTCPNLRIITLGLREDGGVVWRGQRAMRKQGVRK